MTAFARLADNYMTESVDIVIGREGPDVREFHDPVRNHGSKTVLRSEGHPVQDLPVLSLPEDIARALLTALGRHFGAADDVRTLRADYMAERARVDRFIEHLTGPARS